ncbi:hypothetical protein C8A03DRAFT_30363 [Achaetomium macrosporum]|uniref:Uncharacterized protein n=1 Tax=Achaetomium macrosporum TaxID=79813 RepID=A0AAN7H9L3_9PEZI|nr:hypothetical protein C8A03DRAFT_30363 [Achaetomium macrosporum]
MEHEIKPHAAAEQPKAGFAWSNCSNKDLYTRASVKQQAVDDGFTYARRLCDWLRKGTHDMDHRHAAGFALMSGNEIHTWIEEMAELEKANKGLKILVGVAGATGAGKTSLLNALLGYPELLPSSSTEAATATCREDRKELRVHEFENEDERFQAIEEITDIISRGIHKICAIWDLDESEIEDAGYTVESILAKNEHIVKILGQNMTIFSSDADQFAAEVKPYLDSTPTSQGITAWPLIKEVRIYVKAEILKHGIVLVDLQELSDMVEDRSAVAEGYYRNLSVTAIVTPAIRAVDEKAGVKLMSSHQELRMHLDGKCNKDSFCVVVTKIDDLNCDAFCKGTKEARQDAELQAEAGEIKSVSNKSNEAHKELRRSERKLDSMSRKCADLTAKIDTLGGNRNKWKEMEKLKARRVKLLRDRMEHQSLKVTLFNKVAEFDRTLATLESRRKYRCVWIRNQYIKKRICTDFARRQSKLARLAEDDKEKYDGSVEVFPVCAGAFQELLKGKKPMPGFPSKLYTGIPRLRQWLCDAVLAHREEYLNSVLSGLQQLYDDIRRWSDDNPSTVLFSRDKVSSLLQAIHDKYLNKMAAALTRYEYETRQSSPFRHKEEKLASCKSAAVQAASRWVYKYPDDLNSTKRMSWVTYQAILKRDGGPFQSSGDGRPYYDFPLSLATPFLETLREDWVSFFQVELPKTKEPLMLKVGEIWTQYMDEVRTTIQHSAPAIVPVLDSASDTFQGIHGRLCKGISKKIKSISDGASHIHPVFMETLRDGLIPHFQDALKITGKGQYAARQSYLRFTMAIHSPDLFSKGYARMEKAYKEQVDALSADIDREGEAAIRRAHRHISLVLAKFQEDSSVSDRTVFDAVLNTKGALQRAAKEIAAAWEGQWLLGAESGIKLKEGKEGDGTGVAVRMGFGWGGNKTGRMVLDVPDEYVEEVNEREEDNGKGPDESEDEEASEMDTDTADEDSRMDET